MILILSIVFTISVVGAFLAPYPTYKAFNVVMAMALESYVVSLEHAQARQQTPSQPQQPKQGAAEKGK